MNRDEYQSWRNDAKQGLEKASYSADEIKIILKWFDNIKGAGERDLLGEDRMNAYMIYAYPEDISDFKLYNSLMSRLWMYAPLIIKEHKDAK